MPSSIKRNQDSSEKWLISGLGQGGFKGSLEHLAMPKRQELKKKNNDDNRGLLQGLKSQLEGADTG